MNNNNIELQHCRSYSLKLYVDSLLVKAVWTLKCYLLISDNPNLK